MAVGFILSQMGSDNKRYPSRFGSITWNEREQRYSQAKIELYGLFRALKAMRVFIIGVENLTVEVDVFDFKLRHVPGKDHTPADGLSRRPQAPEDPDVDDDHDTWIDNAYSFSIE